MTDEALDYSIRDVCATIDIWRDRPTSDLYVSKLLREFDAYTVERNRRERMAA
jgi:hypothetical protein